MLPDGPSSGEPTQPPPGRCAYRFQHPNRPREYCGREVDATCMGEGHVEDKEQLGPNGRACVWHCCCQEPDDGPYPTVNRDTEEFSRHLDEACRVDNYLEGFILAGGNLRGEDLSFVHMEGADLTRAHLAGTRLWGTHLEEASLDDVSLDGVNLCEAHLEGASLWRARFEGARLSIACLNRAHLRGATLDSRTDCDGTQWGMPAEEFDGEWPEAASVLRTIGQHYRQKGDYETAHGFYLREMRCHHRAVVGDPPGRIRFLKTLPTWAFRFARRAWRWRKLKSMPRALKAVWWALVGHRLNRDFWQVRKLWPRFIWAFHRWLWGYGVMPGRVLGWIAFVIAACAGYFLTTGVEKTGITASHSSNPILDALTLSLITFSTLGYGDWHPATDWGHFWAGVEGVLGALLAAAFLVSLATKYVHRD